MSAVQYLERKVESLQDQLSEAEVSLYKARLAQLHLVPNETVVLSGGLEFKFISAEMFSNGDSQPLWLICLQKKKDGTWGERTKTIYSSSGWSIKS